MINERIVIAPTPILIALKNGGLQKNDLLDVEKLLSILSERDVLFYYMANVHIADSIGDNQYSGDMLEVALKTLVRYTNGVMNVFTTPSWSKFLNEHSDDIRFERNSGRTLYEYLTGECYDAIAVNDRTTTVYETKTCVLSDGVVCIMVVPDIDNDRDDMVMTKKLFSQVLYSLNTVSADMTGHKSLYKGYCDLVVNGAIIERT